MIRKYFVIIKGPVLRLTQRVLLHSLFLSPVLNDQKCQQSQLGQTFQLDATNSALPLSSIEIQRIKCWINEHFHILGRENPSLISNANSLLLDYSPIILPLTELLPTFGLDIGGIGGTGLVKIIPNLIHRITKMGEIQDGLKNSNYLKRNIWFWLVTYLIK